MSYALPSLDPLNLVETKNALHSYALVYGNYLKAYRGRRKHWWHASLRPSLTGLTTGVVYAGVDFELELNLRANLLQFSTASGDRYSEPLAGQSPNQINALVGEFLVDAGINSEELPDAPDQHEPYLKYSAEQAYAVGSVLHSVSAAMHAFRAGIREETSPVQLWPHHFDLSMIWLPGDKVPDADPEDEEYADKQLNFGFTLGDQNIAEPYFYITAYPQPIAFRDTELPNGAIWQSDGFSGVVVPYRFLVSHNEPVDYLLTLWNELLDVGRQHLVTTN